MVEGPQAKDQKQPLDTEKGKEAILPWSLWKECSTLIVDFWTPEAEENKCVSFKKKKERERETLKI